MCLGGLGEVSGATGPTAQNIAQQFVPLVGAVLVACRWRAASDLAPR